MLNDRRELVAEVEARSEAAGRDHVYTGIQYLILYEKHDSKFQNRELEFVK